MKRIIPGVLAVLILVLGVVSMQPGPPAKVKSVPSTEQVAPSIDFYDATCPEYLANPVEEVLYDEDLTSRELGDYARMYFTREKDEADVGPMQTLGYNEFCIEIIIDLSSVTVAPSPAGMPEGVYILKAKAAEQPVMGNVIVTVDPKVKTWILFGKDGVPNIVYTTSQIEDIQGPMRPLGIDSETGILSLIDTDTVIFFHDKSADTMTILPR